MTVQTFRKKPVEVQAVQWCGTAGGATPIINWVLTGGERCARYDEGDPQVGVPESIAIDTLEGTMRAVAGDWVIRGVAGEFYPIKNPIFREMYEPVGPPSRAFLGEPVCDNPTCACHGPAAVTVS